MNNSFIHQFANITNETPNNTIPGLNPMDSSYLITDDNKINLDMINDVKQTFADNSFIGKYEKILNKSIEPLTKERNIKLTTAAIINTLSNYFNEDVDDDTQLNNLLNNIINDNIELKHYIEQLNTLQNNRNNKELLDDLNNNDLITIEIEDSLDKISGEIETERANTKFNIELNKLISKREKEVDQYFVKPNSEELDKIFKEKISNSITNTIIDSSEDNSNDTKYEWNDITSIFRKYNISSNIIELLTNVNDFKQELNTTHSEFVSIQESVNKFNKVILAQIEWASNMPECFDNSIIIKNIEDTIKQYFDKEDIISLFRQYKKTYTKMMLLVSFIPTEFIGRNTCAICLSDEKNIVFVPCGHMCCSSCSTSISSCMVCRGNIDKKQKIYD